MIAKPAPYSTISFSPPRRRTDLPPLGQGQTPVHETWD